MKAVKRMTLLCVILCLFFKPADAQVANSYGVFLSSHEIEQLCGYETVVIDAQDFTAEEISILHADDVTVYSYLNIGSLETFRDYFGQFEHLALGIYENWEDEVWVDVSDRDWQAQILHLADDLSEKGVDGYFVDNCDVYYEFPTDNIFDGLTAILQNLRQEDLPVILNGGDAYVSAYREKYGSASDIMTGVNQECVFSRIDFKSGCLMQNRAADRQYFQNYLENCAQDGMDVYLLEYTSDADLIAQIAEYCAAMGFQYYIADSPTLS